MQRDGVTERAGPVLLGLLAPAVLLAVDPHGWYPFGPVKWLLVTSLGLGGAAPRSRRPTRGCRRPNGRRHPRAMGTARRSWRTP